jgi:hypothetical protein
VAAVTRPKVETVLPSDLVDAAREGRIRIPNFQRSYRWDRRDVAELFDSILRGYPIGNLLVWQRPAEAGTVTLGHLTVGAPALGDAYWVVDGQQRITSLVGALTATADTVDPRFRIYFDLRRGEFVSLARRQQPGVDQFPVASALSTAAANAWIRGRQHLTDEQIALADQVVAAIRDYRIPMYVVAGDDEHALREIFDRMNTFGKPLKSAEVFNALHSLSSHQEPSDLRTLVASVRTFGFGEISEQALMQSLLAIRGPTVDRDFRSEFAGDMDRHRALVDTEKAIGHVVDFLRDEAGIPHIKLVPYALYVPVLARFVHMFGPPAGRAGELLRRWIWRGAAVGVAPQGNTVGLRRGAAAIRDDPVGSAERLLGLLPPQPRRWRPDLSQTGLNRAQARVNALGLLSRRPRFLSRHGNAVSLVDPAALLEEGGGLLTPIVDDPSTLGRGIAGRAIYPPAEKEVVPLRHILAVSEPDLDFLQSHCLDPAMVEKLRSGDGQAFLRDRAVVVAIVIAEHLQSMALFGFPDSLDVAALFDREGDHE